MVMHCVPPKCTSNIGLTCNPRLARFVHYLSSTKRDRPGCQVEAVVRRSHLVEIVFAMDGEGDYSNAFYFPFLLASLSVKHRTFLCFYFLGQAGQLSK